MYHYTYICIEIHVHTCRDTYKCTHMYTYICIEIHTNIYIYLYTHIYNKKLGELSLNINSTRKWGIMKTHI